MPKGSKDRESPEKAAWGSWKAGQSALPGLLFVRPKTRTHIEAHPYLTILLKNQATKLIKYILFSYTDKYIAIKLEKAGYYFRIPRYLQVLCLNMESRCGSCPSPAQSWITGVWTHAPRPSSSCVSWKQPFRGHSVALIGVIYLRVRDQEKTSTGMQVLEVVPGLLGHGHMESQAPRMWPRSGRVRSWTPWGLVPLGGRLGRGLGSKYCVSGWYCKQEVTWIYPRACVPGTLLVYICEGVALARSV